MEGRYPELLAIIANPLAAMFELLWVHIEEVQDTYDRCYSLPGTSLSARCLSVCQVPLCLPGLCLFTINPKPYRGGAGHLRPLLQSSRCLSVCQDSVYLPGACLLHVMRSSPCAHVLMRFLPRVGCEDSCTSLSVFSRLPARANVYSNRNPPILQYNALHRFIRIISCVRSSFVIYLMYLSFGTWSVCCDAQHMPHMSSCI